MPETNTELAADATSTVDSAAAILRRVVRSFVASPDAVEVGAELAEDGARFTLRVAPDDYETVMGPSQRTYLSLRCILTALGSRAGQRFALDCRAVEA